MKTKISNFRLVEVIGRNALDWKFRATVDVTTKKWFREKTETVEVFRKYCGFWFFSETGEIVPNGVNDLVRAYEAHIGKDLSDGFK